MSIRVFLADDHPIVRDGLRFALERHDHDFEVVGEASNGQALVDAAASLRVDVFVVDVTMPDLNGIEATRELVRRDPSVKVIMLSLHDSSGIVDEALRAGARGYLTKTAVSRHVVDAVKAVHAGRCYLSPDIAHQVVMGFVDPDARARQDGATAGLTRQERRILQLIGEGHCSKDIAGVLHLSPHTVQKHRANLMAKLDIHDEVTLVRYAIKEGISSL